MTTYDLHKLTQEVNEFWFGNGQEFRPQWFQKDEAFDQEIEDRFSEALTAAGNAELNAMTDTPEGALALLLMLDQFTRNTRRGQASMYDNDALALKIANEAVHKGFDLKVSPLQRSFFYLPYEHSENLADQDTSIEKFTALGNESGLTWAVQHYDIIKRFGRFPHRNKQLGRTSTAAEKTFLTEDGSSF
ncbi:MAG: hypothetical protein COB46_10000 [Rhodospirillaceae bacterium]|nr:MAG: hypothetical protein COB46_10000 [Rhodospirillaceae bacterium]